jgi:hypothetical protein
MKNCIVYLSTNSITKERISCGLIYIKDDGSHLFKWSKKKLDLFLSLMSNKDKEGIKSLIDITFRGIENHKENNLEFIITHSRRSNSGIIFYGDVLPFAIPVNQFKSHEDELDFWFERMINNEDPRKIKLDKLGI